VRISIYCLSFKSFEACGVAWRDGIEAIKPICFLTKCIPLTHVRIEVLGLAIALYFITDITSGSHYAMCAPIPGCERIIIIGRPRRVLVRYTVLDWADHPFLALGVPFESVSRNAYRLSSSDPANYIIFKTRSYYVSSRGLLGHCLGLCDLGALQSILLSGRGVYEGFQCLIQLIITN